MYMDLRETFTKRIEQSRKANDFLRRLEVQHIKAKRQKSKKRGPIDLGEVLNLAKKGYQVHQFSQYHYRVKKAPYPDYVDVWPTSRKFMQQGAHSSGVYSNLSKTLADIFPQPRLSRSPGQESSEYLS